MEFYAGSNNEDAGAGLRLLEFDESTGRLSERFRVEDAKNPIYLALSPDGRSLYAAEDVSAHVAAPDPAFPGGVSRFKIAPDGSLRRVQSLALAPTVPCHVSVSPDGAALYWAEYRKAHCGAIALAPDGTMRAVSSFHHEGAVGPNAARQEAPHCHWAGLGPDGGTVWVCDLGMDRVKAYRTGRAGEGLAGMEPAPELDFAAPPGTGPRHLAFVPGTDLGLLVTELSSELFLLRFAKGAAPEALDRRSLLPDGFSGETKAAAVRVSPDGKWALASNRGHDSIAAFGIDAAAGRLVTGARTKLSGPFPRDFAFAPGGTYCVVGHKLAHEVAMYRFDAATGAFAPVPGATFGMPKPLAFVWRR